MPLHGSPSKPGALFTTDGTETTAHGRLRRRLTAENAGILASLPTQRLVLRLDTSSRLSAFSLKESAANPSAVGSGGASPSSEQTDGTGH